MRQCHGLYRFDGGIGYYAVINYLIVENEGALKAAFKVNDIVEDIRRKSEEYGIDLYIPDDLTDINRFLSYLKIGFIRRFKISNGYNNYKDYDTPQYATHAEVFYHFCEYHNCEKIMKELADIVNTSKAGLDIHMGNWAVDFKGQWILNDPISYLE